MSSKILHPGFKAPLSEDQKAIIDMLKEALAQALEGQFTSAAVVVCMKEGFSHAAAGRNATALYMACGALQREILDKTSQAGKAYIQQNTGMVS